jgi:hypothetical protein
VRLFSQSYFLYDTRNYINRDLSIVKGGVAFLIHHIISLVLEYHLFILYSDVNNVDGNLILIGIMILEFSNIPHWITYGKIQAGERKEYLWEWFMMEAASYLIVRNVYGVLAFIFVTSSFLRVMFGLIWCMSIYWGILCLMLACKHMVGNVNFKRILKRSVGLST